MAIAKRDHVVCRFLHTRKARFKRRPAVQEHFELVIVLILAVSLVPTFIGLLKAKFGRKKPADA